LSEFVVLHGMALLLKFNILLLH